MFKKVSEFFSLIGWNLLLRWKNFTDLLWTVRHCYGNRKFLRADLQLWGLFLFVSPFSVHRRFAQQEGDHDIYTYGETPLKSLHYMAGRCGLGPEDVVFDLGCAYGRTSFCFHHFFGCRVVGVEKVPTFVQAAEWVKQRYGVRDVEFWKQDMRMVDYSEASFVYLYGSCFEAPFLWGLIEALKTLKTGARVLSVSYPLQDFAEEELFVVEQRFSVPFSWGKGMVYLQRKI